MMRTTIALLFVSSMSVLLSAGGADLANGERINRRCALCHGLYGQGTAGAASPRLGGLPEWYLSKSTLDYKKGLRKNPLMVEISDLEHMSDQDIEDASAYLAGLGIAADPSYDIVMANGDAEAGRKKFNADCKTCHAKDGYGKQKKDAPPLAGQHVGYLFSSIKAFYAKERYHDNDLIDDTFDDISDTTARDILAYTATLDDPRIKPDYHFAPPGIARAKGRPANPEPIQVGDYRVARTEQTVVMRKLGSGVSMDNAIDAMIAKAAAMNMPSAPQPPESAETGAEDRAAPTVVTLEFCSPRHVDDLMRANPLLANYPPCRITLVEDGDGTTWLMMVNLDMLIDGELLPPEAQRVAIMVNQDMLAIMQAGAKGAARPR